MIKVVPFVVAIVISLILIFLVAAKHIRKNIYERNCAIKALLKSAGINNQMIKSKMQRKSFMVVADRALHGDTESERIMTLNPSL